MQKIGHILVTKQALTLCSEYKGWILLGSIFPDLMVNTLLRGHTYYATSKKVFRMMERLEKQGTMNPMDCFRLGIVLHYIEDYFTLPHNEGFRGGLLAHLIYEEEQYGYIKDMKHSDAASSTETGNYGDKQIGNISDWIRRKHMEYVLEDETGVTCDAMYITAGANQVMNYFRFAFRINEAQRKLQRQFAGQGTLPGVYTFFTERR